MFRVNVDGGQLIQTAANAGRTLKFSVMFAVKHLSSLTADIICVMWGQLKLFAQHKYARVRDGRDHIAKTF